MFNSDIFCLVLIMPAALTFRATSEDKTLVDCGGWSALQLVPPLECGEEGSCGVEDVCKPFRGMEVRCIYAMSSLNHSSLQKAKQWAAMCLAGANTHAVVTGSSSKKVLSMVASEVNDGSDGFFSDASEENAALQNDYRRPEIAHWWAMLYINVTGPYGGPQSIEVCNNLEVAKGGKRSSGSWSCQSDIPGIGHGTFRYAMYVTHHYLNYLKDHDKSASPALEKRILEGLYIQHMHTRLLRNNPDENMYDPKLVADCSLLDRPPSTCNGKDTFGPPNYFGNDHDGSFWSTAVGTCFGKDPVTNVLNVCGIEDDEQLLIDIASTILTYHYNHRDEGLPKSGRAWEGDLWTRAVNVCARLDCGQTSISVVKLPVAAI